MAGGGGAKRATREAKAKGKRWADRVEGWLPRPVRGLVSRAREDDVLLLSAGLSFYATVSIVPLVILIMSIISLAIGDQRVQGLAQAVGNSAPKSLGADQAIRRVADLGSRLGIVAFLSGIWPASAYGAGLARSFDRLSPKSRGGTKTLRGRALVLLVLLPLFVLGGIVGSYGGSQVLGSGILGSALGLVLALITGFVGAAAALALIYWIFPPERLPWRAVLTATGATAAAISVVSLAFTAYLSFGTNFEEHYGTSGLAALVLFALWLFLANALVLVGYKLALEAAGADP